MTNGTKRKPWVYPSKRPVAMHPNSSHHLSIMFMHDLEPLWSLDDELPPAQGSQWPQCQD
jgi:hypothetical protein